MNVKGCLWIVNVCWRFLLLFGLNTTGFCLLTQTKRWEMDWTGGCGYISLCFFLYGKCHFFWRVWCGWYVNLWSLFFFFWLLLFFFSLLHVWKRGNLGKWLKWLGMWGNQNEWCVQFANACVIGINNDSNFFFPKRIFLRVLWWIMNQCHIQFIIVGFIKLKAPLQFTQCWIYSVFFYIFLFLE